MKIINAFVSASLVLVASSCKGKDKDGDPAAKPGAGDVARPGGKLAGNFPAEFQAWDLAGRKAAWQMGAWAGEGGSLGSKNAWQVTGDQATVVGPSGEKQLEFALLSPCSAQLTETLPDGARSGTVSTFTIKDGKLITGLGSAGSRKGDAAVVCGSGNVYTLDAKGCQEWSEMFGKWSADPGECGLRKDGDKDVFFYKAHGMESVLDVDGDVIWTGQLRDRHAANHPDLAAAKAAQGL